MNDLVFKSEKGNPVNVTEDKVLSGFIHSEYPEMGDKLLICYNPIGTYLTDGTLVVSVEYVMDKLVRHFYHGSMNMDESLHILKLIFPRGCGFLSHAITTALFHWYLSSTKERVKSCDQKTYIAIDDRTGFYKIGKSHDPGSRIISLSNGNPYLRMIMEIDRNVETELHQKYECKNVEGEWFNLSDNDLFDIYAKYIKK